MIFTLLTYLACFLAFLVLAALILECALKSKSYQGPSSKHFNGTNFLNIKGQGPELKNPGLLDILHWLFSRPKNIWTFPTATQTKPATRVNSKAVVATFINHATVLLQTDGLNIITDPIYSKRASPFSFIGPRRFSDPGVAFTDLPPIDLVIISHNHYDHLNIPTLKLLAKRDNPQIIVPLGNANILKKHGIEKVSELDWWQKTTPFNNLSITCVPAQHSSSRSLSDRNKTLWCGYVIQTSQENIYFAGDTGFGPFVEQIAEKFPAGFRLGLLPIGAFRPKHFMKEAHISPDEALLMQEKMAIRDVLAIHFGTFKLADDGQDEPANRIHELTQTKPYEKKFHVVNNGVSTEFK